VIADVVLSGHDRFNAEEFRRIPKFGMIVHDVVGKRQE
jgi:hypothetical protein